MDSPGALLLDDAVQATLRRYAEAVRASPHNLLSTRGLAELESRHIPECVRFAATLAPGPAAVLDLGAGGGLPGMVVAITRPDLHVTLLDATTKKVVFLDETAAALSLDVATVHGRAEDLHDELGGAFDVVTARAVAPLERLVPWALPFLRPGGVLHAIKGARWEAELRAAAPVLRRHGAEVQGVPSVTSSPGDGQPRTDPTPLVVSIGRPTTR